MKMLDGTQMIVTLALASKQASVSGIIENDTRGKQPPSNKHSTEVTAEGVLDDFQPTSLVRRDEKTVKKRSFQILFARKCTSCTMKGKPILSAGE
jgi:hypothetical protein